MDAFYTNGVDKLLKHCEMIGRPNSDVYVGDADSYYLNMGVHKLEEFLRTTTAPKWSGEIVFQPMAPHCWGPSLPELIGKMTTAMERNAPVGADVRGWRY